jgi:cation:H+ antiporter
VFETLPLVANSAILACSAEIVWVRGVAPRPLRRCDRHADGIGQAAIGVLLLGSMTSLPELTVWLYGAKQR